MSRLYAFSNGGVFKLLFCAVAVIFAAYLLTHTYFRGPSLQERTFHVVSTKDIGANIPKINLNLLAHSNESNNFAEALKSKYGAVSYSGVYQVSTTLTSEEERSYQICVKNSVNDREKNGSKFWPKEQIRRTHHSYLNKKGAVMIEVGGKFTFCS